MLESFRLHLEGIVDEAELVATIRGEFTPTAKVLLGRAFDHCLEDPDGTRNARGGYESGQYRFEADVVEPALAEIDRAGVFQVKATKRYGAHTVVAKVDHILGTVIGEFKSRVGDYRVEKYARSSQWRFQADIFNASAVTYRVFILREDPIALKAIETLPLYPYAAMHGECLALVERFAAFVTRRRLEAYLPERVELLGPQFEDSPTKATRPRGRVLVALPGEVTTPGTRRRWASGAEWAEHADELGALRGTRAKVYCDLAAHLAALSVEFIRTQGREDLEAIELALLNKRTQYVPPRGARAGTDYERVINAVHNALAQLPASADVDDEAAAALWPALPIAPTVLPDLAPVADLPDPVFTLRSPRPAGRPQQQRFCFDERGESSHAR